MTAEERGRVRAFALQVLRAAGLTGIEAKHVLASRHVDEEPWTITVEVVTDAWGEGPHGMLDVFAAAKALQATGVLLDVSAGCAGYSDMTPGCAGNADLAFLGVPTPPEET